MDTVTIRFHGNLNDFLPYRRRERAFEFEARVEGRPAVKDVIESLGVPHPEVDVIVANGRSVDFGYLAREGDRIEVYPVGATPDVAPALHLAPEPPAPRFVLDVHLGRLAAYLRMLGFDALYENQRDDDVLARIAHDEQRILLTRDVGLLKRGAVIYGQYVRETAPERQAAEVLRRYGLQDAIAPFTRCLRCNGPLVPVEPDSAAVLAQAPERVRRRHDKFERCADCGKVFWKGTHYARMRGLIARLRDGA
jgi:uncharacterized protein with PIN domain